MRERPHRLSFRSEPHCSPSGKPLTPVNTVNEKKSRDTPTIYTSRTRRKPRKGSGA